MKNSDNKTNNPDGIIQINQIILFGKRLRQAMKGESNNSFAKRCGWSEKVIRNYLHGETYPSLDRLAIISQVTGRSITWLVAGIEIDSKEKQPLIVDNNVDGADLNSENVVIPELLNSSKSKIGKFVFLKQWLIKEGLINEKLVIMEVSDDVMETTVSEGDIVLVNLKEDGWNGDLNGLYVIKINDLLMVRRLQYDLLKNGYHIKSDNSAYDDYFIENGSDIKFKVIGKIERIFKKP
jgi:phage repressor protein C with HTH and peptisase S24 domain